MQSDEIRSRFLAFFEKRGHAIIPSASLVPENDPSVLFNTAGMQPLVPYLLGQPHPAGKRLANSQKCVRTGDIDDIGDNRHLSFFEMLGNWSLGDYFKKEAISWSMEFLTNKEEGLGLDPKRLYVTVFKGENGIPRDEEAIKIWEEEFNKLNMSVEVASEDEKVTGNIRIVPLGVDDNFWIAGATGPCGGDTEIFYDTDPSAGPVEGKFGDLVDSFRLIEIWNNVFMEFNKTSDGQYEKLVSPNVDTGMGLERTTAVINSKTTVFDTDSFAPILSKIDSYTESDDIKAKRIIADHVRTAVFMIGDGVEPSNTDRSYVLRRLIRRAIRRAKSLNIDKLFSTDLAEVVINKYQKAYPELSAKKELIIEILRAEEEKFQKPLNWVEQYRIDLLEAVNQGIIKKIKNVPILSDTKMASGLYIYENYQTYGIPPDLSFEVVKELRLDVNQAEFDEAMSKHQDLSRIGAEQKFKGGLADHSEEVVKYHTATHLLNQALHEVLGDHVEQKGSNITAERLRFDFSHPEKMTDEQKAKVEEIVNAKIKADLPVQMVVMPKEQALEVGARHAFNEKYGDQITIYYIGDSLESAYSKEFCGGPHVERTGILGTFKIQKEEAVAQGIRRIKATLV